MKGTSGFVQRHRPGITFAGLSSFCLILLLFSNRNVVLKPKEVGQSLFSVLELGIHGLTGWFSSTWNSIGELRELRIELEKARSRLLEYERVSRDVAELRRENERLRSQLGLSQAIAFKQIPAEVIAKDPGNQFATIVVNKGAAAGVRAGMPVVAFQDGLQGLVGKVVLVGMASSTVKPITDPSSYVASRLQNSRYDGLVSGKQLFSGLLLMHYVNKLAAGSIQYGELVISSGMGRLFPKGIHIGRVRQMQSKSYEASLELEVEPIIDFSRLEYVFILDTGE